ncbi:metallophosphoesterase [Sesbania bispinosa]|nr:metallophosphoesterase [Sesbania bispinosa]
MDEQEQRHNWTISGGQWFSWRRGDRKTKLNLERARRGGGFLCNSGHLLMRNTTAQAQ